MILLEKKGIEISQQLNLNKTNFSVTSKPLTAPIANAFKPHISAFDRRFEYYDCEIKAILDATLATILGRADLDFYKTPNFCDIQSAVNLSYLIVEVSKNDTCGMPLEPHAFSAVGLRELNSSFLRLKDEKWAEYYRREQQEFELWADASYESHRCPYAPSDFDYNLLMLSNAYFVKDTQFFLYSNIIFTNMWCVDTKIRICFQVVPEAQYAEFFY